MLIFLNSIVSLFDLVLYMGVKEHMVAYGNKDLRDMRSLLLVAQWHNSLLSGFDLHTVPLMGWLPGFNKAWMHIEACPTMTTIYILMRNPHLTQ